MNGDDGFDTAGRTSNPANRSGKLSTRRVHGRRAAGSSGGADTVTAGSGPPVGLPDEPDAPRVNPPSRNATTITNGTVTAVAMSAARRVSGEMTVRAGQR
jgi:hypothetical protein